MKIAELVTYLDRLAPVVLQESYDNSGLQVGDPGQEATGALLCIDPVEEVILEAAGRGLNLVIAHHPLIFHPLKRILPSGPVERTLMTALKHGIAVYASHTNLDKVIHGVNGKIAGRMGLEKTRILQPEKGWLAKLVTYVPATHLETLRKALFNAGAGNIGDYDMCSFSLEGEGSFRGLEGTQPFTGEKGKLSLEKEVRLETIFPVYIQEKVISALLEAHPYEEVAYDIYRLENRFARVGLGLVGDLKEAMDPAAFLTMLKKKFHCEVIRHTLPGNHAVRRVAVCGGSGSSLLPDAIAASAGAFVSADFKYHQFFETNQKILIADIGHYESEQFTKEIFYEYLKKKYSNFAVHFSDINTNPVKYFYQNGKDESG